ncbi:hypothetical protein [Spongiibacter marinus]|uniref:hypothetical protein n=1 Tax=Spongiibacter marinus TaxID=354246 RepID=UPI00196030B2|nr:hypothetical protein [Spongiibacter marinus]MBM7422934.1 hypothetical protein [Spongiibacter marinus]
MIKLPKMESIKARVHRVLDGKFKSIIMSRTLMGKDYTSLLIDDGAGTPAPT